MQIKAIHHAAIPMDSQIRNAFIDFSEMSTSTVAVVSDQTRDGKLLVGYGFCSNGRYAQRGIIEDRLIPRLMSAGPPVFYTTPIAWSIKDIGNNIEINDHCGGLYDRSEKDNYS